MARIPIHRHQDRKHLSIDDQIRVEKNRWERMMAENDDRDIFYHANEPRVVPFIGDSGLAVFHGRLTYRWKGGFGYGWLPKTLMDSIVNVYNPAACFLMGHDGSVPDYDEITLDQLDVCPHCNAVLNRYPHYDPLDKHPVSLDGIRGPDNA